MGGCECVLALQALLSRGGVGLKGLLMNADKKINEAIKGETDQTYVLSPIQDLGPSDLTYSLC